MEIKNQDHLHEQKVIYTSAEELQEIINRGVQKALETERPILVREVSTKIQELLHRSRFQLLSRMFRKFRNFLLGILLHLPLLFISAEKYERYLCLFLSARDIFRHKRNHAQALPTDTEDHPSASEIVGNRLRLHINNEDAIEAFIKDVQACEERNELLDAIRKMAERHPELRGRGVLTGTEFLTRIIELSSLKEVPKSMDYFQRTVGKIVKKVPKDADR